MEEFGFDLKMGGGGRTLPANLLEDLIWPSTTALPTLQYEDIGSTAKWTKTYKKFQQGLAAR